MNSYRLLSLCVIFISTALGAQNITSNAAYKARMDSLIRVYLSINDEWNATISPHFKEAARLEKEAEEHPERKDSLLAIATKERKIGQVSMPALQERMNNNQAERQAFREKYALVFEDAFPYFFLRDQFSKDSLTVLLKNSSQEIQQSANGKALRKYIKNRQIVEGDHFRKFRCYDVNGKRFDWNLTKGKKVFLIHDGLWCMTHGMDNSALRKYLQYLSESAPDCFPLIVVNCEGKDDLRAAIEEYGLHDFCVVSEFNKVGGVLNWLYNDSATPTCHHIDEHGILVKTTKGIDQDYLEKVFLGIR